MLPPSHPILSRDEAIAFETNFFRDNESREWAAMGRAGRAVADGVLRDIREIGGIRVGGRVLVLAGKGNNAGDALIAARAVLEQVPGASADVVFVFGERALRTLARRAWRELLQAAPDRVKPLSIDAEIAAPSYDLCLDGVFGLQFRVPLEGRAAAALSWANGLPIRLRAAVDLPSGLHDPAAFRADFTYATGMVKSSLLKCANAGRLRYLDLGFFGLGSGGPDAPDRVLIPPILSELAALRDSHTDKRTYGHLCVVAGSRGYPGAALMAVRAALRSGVGLVTAFVPESLVAAFAARAPEAMWVAWPETSAGGLARRGWRKLAPRFERATAVVAGPGLGREPETLSLLAELVKSLPGPVLLDADALQPAVLKAARVSAKASPALVLTPHAGEYARIGGGDDLPGFCAKRKATVVLKGPTTRICRGEPPTIFHSIFGGPVLARGGSGDILSGLVGGLLAQSPKDPLLAACRGAVWHGMAADALARAHGQTSVNITQLLDFLPEVLRQGPVL
jgi:NAD(P)H-hydrate epimerase